MKEDNHYYLVVCHEAGHMIGLIRSLVAQYGRKRSRNIVKSLQDDEFYVIMERWDSPSSTRGKAGCKLPVQDRIGITDWYPEDYQSILRLAEKKR